MEKADGCDGQSSPSRQRSKATEQVCTTYKTLGQGCSGAEGDYKPPWEGSQRKRPVATENITTVIGKDPRPQGKPQLPNDHGAEPAAVPRHKPPHPGASLPSHHHRLVGSPTSIGAQYHPMQTDKLESYHFRPWTRERQTAEPWFRPGKWWDPPRLS